MAILRPPKDFPTPLFKLTLALLAGLLIGGGGIYWYAKTFPLAFAPTPTTPAEIQTATVPADPTRSWTPYSSTAGQFSLRFNPNWKIKKCTDNPETVFLAPTAAGLAVCNSGQTGQIQVFSMSGDHTADQQLSQAQGFGAITSQDVMVHGITGKKMRSSLINPGPAAAPAGTITVVYIFYTNGRTYVARYHQEPSGDRSTDAYNDFVQMVKTLSFSASS